MKPQRDIDHFTAGGQTLTDNEVIAAFDGREDGYNEHGVWQKLKYNSDWRDLMPVWYKFRDLNFDGCEDKAKHHISKIKFAILNYGPSPERACKLLAEGIKWYNSINQTVKK